jgi:hypothetical protein
MASMRFCGIGRKLAYTGRTRPVVPPPNGAGLLEMLRRFGDGFSAFPGRFRFRRECCATVAAERVESGVKVIRVRRLFEVA